jgi:hypothetical protein
MRIIFASLAIAAAVISTDAQLTGWQTTRDGWSTGDCKLVSSRMDITVNALHADVVEEAEIKTIGTVSSGDSKTLEITGTFSVTEGTIVRSMLLWNGNKILKAKLRTRADADSSYEDVVDRDTEKPVVIDPAIISYLGDNRYQFRIYPVSIGESRKIRVLSSVPLSSEMSFPVTTAFADHIAEGPNTIPVTFNIKDGASAYTLLHENSNRLINTNTTYLLPTTGNYWSFFSNFYISKSRQKGIKAFSASLLSGNGAGNYYAVFSDIPDCITKMVLQGYSLDARINTGSKTYAYDIETDQGIAAYIKTAEAWDRQITFTLYNKSGAIQKDTIIRLDSCDIIRNQDLPLIWAAKYTFQERLGELGSLFGFVDRNMSLLAMESDTLSTELSLAYSANGVPPLTEQEIIIAPEKKAAAPAENIFFEVDANMVSDATAIKEFEVFNITPTSIEIRLPASEKGLVDISLFDARGREVFRQRNISLKNGFVRLSLTNKASGLHVLKVKTASRNLMQKVIFR